MPVFPEDSRKRSIVVEKALCTCAAVPETGSERPVVEAGPTVRPCASRSCVTCLIVALVAP